MSMCMKLLTERADRPYIVSDGRSFPRVQWMARAEPEFLNRGYGMTEEEACRDLERRHGGHLIVDLAAGTVTRYRLGEIPGEGNGQDSAQQGSAQ